MFISQKRTQRYDGSSNFTTFAEEFFLKKIGIRVNALKSAKK
jgi:hypothetical protein